MVYNPVAMEFVTKWNQAPHQYSAGQKAATNYYSKHRERLQGPGKTQYGSGRNKKVPYGRLSVKELAKLVEQARMRSPFAEDFRSNDPITMKTQTPLTSVSNSSTSVGSIASSNSIINTQPVIPDVKLSTPFFDHPQQIKRENHRVNKTTGKSNL